MKSGTLYYLSAIPISIGVLMAYKAGMIAAKEEQTEKTWEDATTPNETKE